MESMRIGQRFPVAGGLTNQRMVPEHLLKSVMVQLARVFSVVFGKHGKVLAFIHTVFRPNPSAVVLQLVAQVAQSVWIDRSLRLSQFAPVGSKVRFATLCKSLNVGNTSLGCVTVVASEAGPG